MKLLLNTYCSDEFFDGYDAAFVAITPELASLILRRRASFENLKLSDADVTAIEYSDCAPIFLDSLPKDADGNEMEIPYDEPFIATEHNPEYFEQHAARTECDRMVIGHDDIYWTCYPKHCDYAVETRPIDYETVRRAALEVRA